jgi:glyoxalase superfamily protein
VATRFQVAVDCADPAKLATFWGTALGYKEDPPEGYATWEEFLIAQGIPEEEHNSQGGVIDPDGVGPRLYFQRVPEPKAGKNRLHLDLDVARDVPPEEYRERIDAEVERLVAVGATKVRAFEERGEYWVVMQDPEENEFCLM